MKVAKFVILVLPLVGCSGTKLPQQSAEEQRLDANSDPYKLPLEQRALPPLTDQASLRDVMIYALASNGAVEAAYRDWAAAVHQVVVAGALPDPSISIGALSARESFRTLNSFLDAVRVMVEQDFSSSEKLSLEARSQLLRARAAGERFRAARNQLYRDVAEQYSELTSIERSITELRHVVALLQDSQGLLTHGYHAGTTTALIEIRKLQVELDSEENELQKLESDRGIAKAALNRLLNRLPDASIGSLDDPIFVPSLPDQNLLQEQLRSQSPTVAEQRARVDETATAVQAAEAAGRPSYVIAAGVDDPLMPFLGLRVTLPVDRQKINAGIRAAEESQAAALAQLRDTTTDVNARLAQALILERDATRAGKQIREKLLPGTQDLRDLQQAAYGSGEGMLTEVFATERSLAELRRLLIVAEKQRLNAVAVISELTGQDLFGLFPENVIGATQSGEGALR